MAETESAERSKDSRECPYCRETVKAEAVLCKHCGSALTPEKAPHGGVCPYCKEEIHPEAIRCKHCRSDLSGGADPSMRRATMSTGAQPCVDCDQPSGETIARFGPVSESSGGAFPGGFPFPGTAQAAQRKCTETSGSWGRLSWTSKRCCDVERRCIVWDSGMRTCFDVESNCTVEGSFTVTTPPIAIG